MAISPIAPVVKQKKGGGLFGKVAGGLAGAVGGAFFGNPILGAQIGSQIGGIAGEAAKPSSSGMTNPVSPLQSSMKMDPETQIAALAEGKRAAINNMDLSPEEAQGLVESFDMAKKRLRERMGGFGGSGTSTV